MHAYRHGCWYNKDIGQIVEESGLEVVEAKRHHFGTTWWFELKPSQEMIEEREREAEAKAAPENPNPQSSQKSRPWWMLGMDLNSKNDYVIAILTSMSTKISCMVSLHRIYRPDVPTIHEGRTGKHRARYVSEAGTFVDSDSYSSQRRWVSHSIRSCPFVCCDDIHNTQIKFQDGTDISMIEKIMLILIRTFPICYLNQLDCQNLD